MRWFQWIKSWAAQSASRQSRPCFVPAIDVHHWDYMSVWEPLLRAEHLKICDQTRDDQKVRLILIGHVSIFDPTTKRPVAPLKWLGNATLQALQRNKIAVNQINACSPLISRAGA